MKKIISTLKSGKQNIYITETEQFDTNLLQGVTQIGFYQLGKKKEKPGYQLDLM